METLFARKIVAEPVAKAEEVEVADPDDINEAMAALISGIEGLGMGETAAAAPTGVPGWGGEPMGGGARRHSRRKAHRKSHRKAHRKSHRRSAHRKGASRRTRRQA